MASAGQGLQSRVRFSQAWGHMAQNKAPWVPGFLGMAFHLHVPSACVMTRAWYMQPLFRQFYRAACGFKGLQHQSSHPRSAADTEDTGRGPGQEFCLDPELKSLEGLPSPARVICPFINHICLALGWVVLHFLILKQCCLQILNILGLLWAIIWSPSPFPPGAFCP